jgi:hypothetical protein
MGKQPRGWYPDPENPLRERLWNGHDWVDRTRPRSPGAPAKRTVPRSRVRPKAILVFSTVIAVAAASVLLLQTSSEEDPEWCETAEECAEVLRRDGETIRTLAGTDGRPKATQLQTITNTLDSVCAREHELRITLWGPPGEKGASSTDRFTWRTARIARRPKVYRYWVDELGEHKRVLHAVAAAVPDENVKAAVRNIVALLEEEQSIVNKNISDWNKTLELMRDGRRNGKRWTELYEMTIPLEDYSLLPDGWHEGVRGFHGALHKSFGLSDVFAATSFPTCPDEIDPKHYSGEPCSIMGGRYVSSTGDCAPQLDPSEEEYMQLVPCPPNKRLTLEELIVCQRPLNWP